jgi:hypothetical protein
LVSATPGIGICYIWYWYLLHLLLVSATPGIGICYIWYWYLLHLAFVSAIYGIGICYVWFCDWPRQDMSSSIVSCRKMAGIDIQMSFKVFFFL